MHTLLVIVAVGLGFCGLIVASREFRARPGLRSYIVVKAAGAL